MARGFNKAIIIGNLARDPELRFTQGGQALAKFSVAVNRQWKDKSGELQKEVDFIPVAIWGKMAENCDRYLRKGSAVLVEGRIHVGTYEKDGQKRYHTDIVAQTVQFLGGGNPEETNAERNALRNAPDSARHNREEQNRNTGRDSTEPNIGPKEEFSLSAGEGDEEDIPF